MPRWRAISAAAVGGSFVWPAPRSRSTGSAAAPCETRAAVLELELVRLRDGSGWYYAVMSARREIGRLAHVLGVDAAGDWRWAVRNGACGYELTRADALAALARAWRANGAKR